MGDQRRMPKDTGRHPLLFSESYPPHEGMCRSRHMCQNVCLSGRICVRVYGCPRMRCFGGGGRTSFFMGPSTCAADRFNGRISSGCSGCTYIYYVTYYTSGNRSTALKCVIVWSIVVFIAILYRYTLFLYFTSL